MSNTSTVTPYVGTGSGGGAAATVCAGVVVGAAALAVAGTAASIYGVYRLGKWLAKSPELTAAEMDEIRAVQEKYEDEIRQMESVEMPDLKTVNLHLQDAETLKSAAADLGYRVIDASEEMNRDAGAPLLLERGDGERMAVTQDDQGHLSVHATADQSLLLELVSHHTEYQVLSHLESKGMSIETARLSNGELQILSRESDAKYIGGNAEVKAQIRADGTAWVDIDKCRGNRCETIVAGIAEAMGGTVDGTVKKDAYFQLPGEPTRTKVKA